MEFATRNMQSDLCHQGFSVQGSHVGIAAPVTTSGYQNITFVTDKEQQWRSLLQDIQSQVGACESVGAELVSLVAYRGDLHVSGTSRAMTFIQKQETILREFATFFQKCQPTTSYETSQQKLFPHQGQNYASQGKESHNISLHSTFSNNVDYHGFNSGQQYMTINANDLNPARNNYGNNRGDISSGDDDLNIDDDQTEIENVQLVQRKDDVKHDRHEFSCIICSFQCTGLEDFQKHHQERHQSLGSYEHVINDRTWSALGISRAPARKNKYKGKTKAEYQREYRARKKLLKAQGIHLPNEGKRKRDPNQPKKKKVPTATLR